MTAQVGPLPRLVVAVAIVIGLVALLFVDADAQCPSYDGERVVRC